MADNAKFALNASGNYAPREIAAALVSLDLSDKLNESTLYDGKFLDVDLYELGEQASRYIRAYPTAGKRKVTLGIARLLNSTRGLHEFGATLAGKGQASSLLIERAMMEGILSTIKCRNPNFGKISGFDQRFIDAEFLFYFDEIFSGKANFENGWKTYWEGLLAGCGIDMFVNQGRGECEFVPMRNKE